MRRSTGWMFRCSCCRMTCQTLGTMSSRSRSRWRQWKSAGGPIPIRATPSRKYRWTRARSAHRPNRVSSWSSPPFCRRQEATCRSSRTKQRMVGGATRSVPMARGASCVQSRWRNTAQSSRLSVCGATRPRPSSCVSLVPGMFRVSAREGSSSSGVLGKTSPCLSLSPAATLTTPSQTQRGTGCITCCGGALVTTPFSQPCAT